jgi:hypothetical protein
MYTSSNSISDYDYSSEWTGTGYTNSYIPYRNAVDSATTTYYHTPTTVYDSPRSIKFCQSDYTPTTVYNSLWGIKFCQSNYLADNEYIIVSDTNYSYPYYGPRVFSKEDMLQVKRAELRSNLVIQVKSRSNVSQYPGEAEPERKALETLRETISETEFRKYLRYGFVLVKGQSGKIYQIFKNQSHCKVWLGGKLVEEVCVRIKDKQIPMTDNIIAFKTMIEASEEGFKKLGNVYKMAV